MTARLKNILPILSPFLLTLAVLVKATVNPANYFNGWEFLTVSGIAFGIVAIVTGVCFLIFRNVTIAGFVACVSLIFLAYFVLWTDKIQLWALQRSLPIIPRKMVRYTAVILAYAGLVFVFSKWLYKTKRMGFAVFSMTAVFLIGSLIEIATFRWEHQPYYGRQFWSDASPSLKTSGQLPDIFLIVMDSFTSDESLNKYWKFDNSRFTEELRQRGFQVVTNARSGANWTYYSIGSILNMNTNVVKMLGQRDAESLMYTAFFALNYSAVPSTLFGTGYDIVNLSVFPILGHQPKRYYVPVHMLDKLAATTHPTYETVRVTFVDFVKNLFDLILEATRSDLKNSVESDAVIMNDLLAAAHATSNKPKFVYTHLFAPHPPNHVDRFGKAYAPDRKPPADPKDAYLEALIYSGKTMLKTIDAINSKKSGRPKVIILMGDHGYRSLTEPNEEVKNAEAYTCHFSVLLPGHEHERIVWDNFNTVDTFRVIFNLYFGTSYSYLSKPKQLQTDKAENR